MFLPDPILNRRIVLSSVAVVYYLVIVYSLIFFNAGLLVSTFFMFGLPAMLMAMFSYAPGSVLLNVSLLGAGMAIILEGIAHIYGLWYTVGYNQTRLFELVAVEAIFALVLQVIFLSLMYELWFDDGSYVEQEAITRFGAFGAFFCVSVMVLAFHHYFISDLWIENSYLWLWGGMLLACVSALLVHRVHSIRFIKRLWWFSLVGSLPLLLALLVSMENVHKVFAYTDVYLHTFTILGNAIPIEEVFLALAIPFFVATIYELYLDDSF